MSKENNEQTQGVPAGYVQMSDDQIFDALKGVLWNCGRSSIIQAGRALLSAAPQAQPVEAELAFTPVAEDYESRHVQHIVKKQGSVLCNYAYTRYESGKCLIVEMDLRSKYCELVASSGHGCLIGATERSLHLDGSQPRDANTWIEFDLPGGRWVFVTGSVSRYTLTCVFLRDTVSDCLEQTRAARAKDKS